MIDSEWPLVSVIIPVFNGRRFIQRAVQSVVEQSYPKIETLVIEDGSLHTCADIIGAFPSVRYIHQTQQGNATARNRGLLEAQGEFICFLDQDDYFVPQKIERQYSYFCQHPETPFITGLTQEFLETGTKIPSWVRPGALTPHAGASPGTWFIKKTLFTNIGQFDPTLTSTSDTDWLYRAKKQGIVMTPIPEIVLYKSIHTSNQSARPTIKDVKAYHRELIHIFRPTSTYAS